MTQKIKFDAPPVIETVLGVQFSTLKGFTAAHAGWFWREYVAKFADGPNSQWNQTTEASKLPATFEKFGSEDVWSPPRLNVVHGVVSPRTQLIRADGERMIQIQDDRFVLNWRKQAGPFPRYESLLPEFRSMLNAFETFCAEADFGLPSYNVWEVVYIDQVKKGTMWDSARNLNRIFPALTAPPVSLRHAPPSGDETVSAAWRFSLANQRGRLHVQIQQVRVPPSNEEVIQLTTTARGAVNDKQSWEQGMDFGHEALSETFLSITSPEAQESWKKGA